MHKVDLTAGPLAGAWRNNTIGTLYEFAKRAPGTSLRLSIGAEEILLIQDAETTRHILRTNARNYAKNYGGFLGLFGESRLTSDGVRWERLRDLSQPYIGAARSADVVRVANRSFVAAVQGLLDARGGEGRVDVEPAANRAAATVVSEVALGFGAFDVAATIEDFRAILRYGSRGHWNIGGAQVADSPAERARFEAARANLQRRIRTVLQTAASGPAGLVSDIGAAESDGVDPVSEIASLLFAGFDTTSTAISWGLFLLAASPDLQSALRADVRRVMGDGPLVPEALEALPQLAAFRNEVLRIFPPIPAIGRTALAVDRLGDEEVRAGQPVMISIIGLHHDPAHFAAPAQVRLARYPGGRLPRELTGHHLPFSDGHRICAGARIANVELLAAFAILIDRLVFELADTRPLEFEWVASLRRRGGTHLRIRPA